MLFVEKYLFLAEETLQSLKGGERKKKRKKICNRQISAIVN